MGILLVLIKIFFGGIVTGGVVGYFFSSFVLLIFTACVILYFLKGLSREGEAAVNRFLFMERPFLIGFLLGMWGMQVYFALETPFSVLR